MGIALVLISYSALLPSKQKHFRHFNGNNLVIITDPTCISPDTHKWQALLNILLNLRVPHKAANDKMSHYQLSKMDSNKSTNQMQLFFTSL
jgi:hypothetical protein